MSTGLADSTDSPLNLASYLFMPSLITAFLEKLMNVSETFVSFERSLPFLTNGISLTCNFITQKWSIDSPKFFIISDTIHV